MKYALNIDSDGRILSATYEQYAPEGAALVETLPEGDISNYRYADGQYIYDPLPVPEEPEAGPTMDERVSDLEEALEMILMGVTE